MKSSNLAIITARGGSKRIPRKNIKEFSGKPIIEYSIRAALDSGCFDEVMVSTDDDEISEIAINAGAKVPFKRSNKNSDDFSTTADVLLEVLDTYTNQGASYDNICCIYPTAPFITSKKIKDSFKKLQANKSADVLLPLVRFGFPIQRALKLENGMTKMFQPEHMLTRSQDLEPGFHDAGQFYWIRVEPFLKRKLLYSDNMLGYELSELEVQDIDNEIDWELAELKFELSQKFKS